MRYDGDAGEPVGAELSAGETASETGEERKPTAGKDHPERPVRGAGGKCCL
jgi:hypothetical protein